MWVVYTLDVTFQPLKTSTELQKIKYFVRKFRHYALTDASFEWISFWKLDKKAVPFLKSTKGHSLNFVKGTLIPSKQANLHISQAPIPAPESGWGCNSAAVHKGYRGNSPGCI